MKLAVMQPYFFPYIGYFQCIKAVDKYIVYDRLNYIYQGWVDRNRLVDKSGQIFYIRPQLKDASVSKLISEIQLQPRQFWRQKMIKTLKFSYAGAPYFDETLALISDILSYETESLSDFNFNAIKSICRFLDIETELTNEMQKYEALERELRNKDEALLEEAEEKPEVKVIRALKLCEMENANVFINAAGGAALYSKPVFKEQGIDLNFIRTNPIQYPQFTQEFFPGLSIIDVLMHNGKEGTKKLLTEYELH
jgi:hypothetical protein